MCGESLPGWYARRTRAWHSASEAPPILSSWSEPLEHSIKIYLWSYILTLCINLQYIGCMGEEQATGGSEIPRTKVGILQLKKCPNVDMFLEY